MSQHHIVIVVGMAILNGLFSPALLAVFALHPLWYPALLPTMLPFVFMVSSLIVATLTLMIAGVPAALYERLLGNGETTVTSGFVWLLGVMVLTLPAVPSILRALGFGS
jgi:hypothetical protein